MLRIFALGKLEIIVDDKTVTAQLSATQKALIFYLAWMGCPQERGHVAELLWPERSSERSLSNLRTVLSQLRSTLGSYLYTTRTSIGLNAEKEIWLDAKIVSALTKTKCQSSPSTPDAARLPQLESAIALYDGALLEGSVQLESVAWNEWSEEQRRRIEMQVVAALGELGTHASMQGDYERAANFFDRQVQLSPYDEDTYRLLMDALARNGQPGRALRIFKRYADLLQQDFGAVPPGKDLIALAQRIRAGQVTSTPKEPLPAANPRRGQPRRSPILPQTVKPLLAREAELQTLIDHVRRGERLISVVGMGGIGKTHLLTASLSHLRHFFRDGVFYIDLSSVPLAESAEAAQHQLVMAIAAALGLIFDTAEHEAEQIISHLGERRLCLVLDNFETMITATPFVTRMLTESQSTILIGSRVRLKLSYEALVPLEGLLVPAEGNTSIERYGAVTLFVRAAQRTTPYFRLTDENAPAVARISRQVGGLPLALELAAAWVEHFSPQEISQRIEDSLSFLATSSADVPERQKRLQTLFAQSCLLLTAAEVRLLAQLSLFAGTFERDAALTITGATMETLVELVDKQWVQVTGAGHYFLHPLVKRFAHDRLTQHEPEPLHHDTCHAYSRYFIDYVRTLLNQNSTQPNADVLHEIRKIQSDLATVLSWLQVEDAGEALDLVCALDSYWSHFGILTEAANWLDQALARYATQDRRMVRGLSLAVHWIRRQPNLSQLEPWIEKAFEMIDQIENPVDLADLCRQLGWHAFNRRPHPWHERGRRAVQYLEQTVSLLRLLHEDEAAADALFDQAYMQLWTPHFAQAAELLVEAEKRAGPHMSPRHRALLYHRRSVLAYVQQRFATAWDDAELAWVWHTQAELGQELEAWLHKHSADVAWHLGRYDDAWRHAQSASVIFRQQALSIGQADLSLRLAMTAHKRSDIKHAISHFAECIELSRSLHFDGNLSAGFIGIGFNLFTLGQVERGARLIGYGEKLLQDHAGSLFPWDEESVKAILSQAQIVIAQTGIEYLVEEGRRFTPTHAYDLINLTLTNLTGEPRIHQSGLAKEESIQREASTMLHTAKSKRHRRSRHSGFGHHLSNSG